MWALSIAIAFGAPGRASAVLPGVEPVDAGTGHLGFTLYGTVVGWHSLGGLNLGVSPARGTLVELHAVQSPEAPWRAAGVLSARQVFVDTEGFAFAGWMSATGFRDFEGRKGVWLAGTVGAAMRIGGPHRFVDVSIAPASVLMTRPDGSDLGAPFLFPTAFVFAVGWNRQITDDVRLRTGWPDGVGLHWRGEHAYVDLSAMALGVPLWADLEVGIRF